MFQNLFRQNFSYPLQRTTSVTKQVIVVKKTQNYNLYPQIVNPYQIPVYQYQPIKYGRIQAYTSQANPRYFNTTRSFCFNQPQKVSLNTKIQTYSFPNLKTKIQTQKPQIEDQHQSSTKVTQENTPSNLTENQLIQETQKQVESQPQTQEKIQENVLPSKFFNTTRRFKTLTNEEQIIKKMRFQLNLLAEENLREVTRTTYKLLTTCHFPLLELDEETDLPIADPIPPPNVDSSNIHQALAEILIEKIFFDTESLFLNFYSDFTMYINQFLKDEHYKKQEQEEQNQPQNPQEEQENPQTFIVILKSSLIKMSQNFKFILKSSQDWSTMTNDKQLAHKDTRSKCYIQLAKFIAELYLREVFSIKEIEQICMGALKNFCLNYKKGWEVIHMEYEAFLEFLIVLFDIIGCKIEKDMKDWEFEQKDGYVNLQDAFESLSKDKIGKCLEDQETDCWQLFDLFEWIVKEYENNDKTFVSFRLFCLIENLITMRNKNVDFGIMWPDIKYFWNSQKLQEF